MKSTFIILLILLLFQKTVKRYKTQPIIIIILGFCSLENILFVFRAVFIIFGQTTWYTSLVVRFCSCRIQFLTIAFKSKNAVQAHVHHQRLYLPAACT